MFSKFKHTFLKYGFVHIPKQNKLEFEKFISKIGYTMKTSYSSSKIQNDFWYIDGKISDISSDSAYSNIKLSPHTDGTYMSEPPKVIAFNCIKNSEIGGEHLLVDSQEIKSKIPLSLINLYHTNKYRWKNDSTKYYFQNYAPIFYNDIVRYNEYDLDENLTNDQYIQTLKYIISKCKTHTIKLEPEHSLFINNHRILHGRNSFEGERIMYGCYIDNNVMQSFLNKITNE